MACGKTVAGLEITKGNTVAKNTGRGYRRGLIRGRFQKFNPNLGAVGQIRSPWELS